MHFACHLDVLVRFQPRLNSTNVAALIDPDRVLQYPDLPRAHVLTLLGECGCPFYDAKVYMKAWAEYGLRIASPELVQLNLPLLQSKSLTHQTVSRLIVDLDGVSIRLQNPKFGGTDAKRL